LSLCEERDRAIAFLRALSVSLARHAEPFPWGFALFEPRLPDVWHLNSVWVDTLPDEVPATAFIAELERLQGGAGLRHRRVVVVGERSGVRLSEPLRRLGWSTTRDLLMVWRRPPDRAGPPAKVVGVDEAGACTFTTTMLRNSPDLLSNQASEQLVAARALLAEAGARFFGAVVDGEIVSLCELYDDGETARIGAVETLPQHRNRGFARAVVRTAIASALARGCDLVFLEAEEHDWPRELYGRLGFDPVGYLHEFTRPGADAPADRPLPLEYGSGAPLPASGPEPGDAGP
jgi:GNAT superfamily N-acetyltransferase